MHHPGARERVGVVAFGDFEVGDRRRVSSSVVRSRRAPSIIES